jgi:hypothetical protein
VARRFSCGFLPNRLLLLLAGFGLCACFTLRLVADDARTKLQSQYDSEQDPVAKAKILAKMGRLEIDQARADLKSGNDVQSLSDLQHYRDEVRSTIQALAATGISAEKHPAGFKELQISLRETLRRVDDLINTLPYDKRPWFEEVRTDLAKFQAVLIDDLFPTPHNKDPRKGDP